MLILVADLTSSAGARTDNRNGSVRETPDVTIDLTSRDRSRDRLVELPSGADSNATASRTESPNPTTFPRRSTTRYDAEGRPIQKSRPNSQKPPHAPRTSDLELPASKLPQAPSRNLPHTLDDLLDHKTSKEVRPDSHSFLKKITARVVDDTYSSSIEQGYDAIHVRDKDPTPKPTNMSPPTQPPAVRRSDAATEHHTRMPPPSTPAQRDAKRYGMFSPHHRSPHAKSLRESPLFVGSDEDEAVQVSGAQEIGLGPGIPSSGGNAKRAAPLSMGASMLGAPKKPPNATGEAPVAPMMHNSKSEGKGGGKGGGNGD